MKRIVMIFLLCLLFMTPVRALDLEAPEVPDSAESLMPREPQNLKEGILQILKNAITLLRPDMKEASRVCLSIMAVVMNVSLLRMFPGKIDRCADLVGAIGVSVLLLTSAGSMINLAVANIREISEYGKLLLPVLAAAMAAQGGITTSSALYAGTALFDGVLSGLISGILTPLIYLFFALSIAVAAVGDELLKKLRDLLKWFMTWSLKTLLYIYTGFISITGVVSGPTDAAALKATKLTISGVVPVVGGILSDASEAVLVSAGTVKNAIGVYGLFAVAAIWLEPFVMIGCHYLLLRLTGAVCSIFGSKSVTELIHDFGTGMGILLGMTGAVSLMILISTVCFMRGVG